MYNQQAHPMQKPTSLAITLISANHPQNTMPREVRKSLDPREEGTGPEAFKMKQNSTI